MCMISEKLQRNKRRTKRKKLRGIATTTLPTLPLPRNESVLDKRSHDFRPFVIKKTNPLTCRFTILTIIIIINVWISNPFEHHGGILLFAHGFSTPHSSWSHAAMKEFDDRLVRLERETAPEALQSFFEPQLTSFSVQPGAQRVSITSTCYALQAMLATETPSIYQQSSSSSSGIVLDPSITTPSFDDPRTPVQEILRALVNAEWRSDDLFQVPVLLYTLLRVDPCRNFAEADPARVQDLVQAVLAARPRRRDGLRQAFSDYIVFQCTQVYAQLYDATVCSPPTDFGQTEYTLEETEDNDKGSNENLETTVTKTQSTVTTLSGLPPGALPDGAAATVALALARCAENAETTLCRELALRAAGDEYDVMRLAYSLLTYVVSTERLASSSSTSSTNTAASRQVMLVTDGQASKAVAEGARVRPVNRKLVKAGLAAFFEEQNHNGMWDKGQPIYRSFRRTGRNIGNAFIFAVDTVATLLQYLPAEDFRPHLTGLRKVLDWIEQHHKVEILPDYCDPETGQCTGKTIQGWSSPHLDPDSGPQAWSTAQTIACISRMKTVVESLMHDDVLEEFRGIKLSQKGPSAASWDRLLDADLGKCGLERPCTIKEILDKRMITPRLLGEDESVLNESYSAILFGPPGTAKSTICQSLAERIGYDFLVIDTSEFLADGLTSVASRIRYVFSRLQALRRCVILFDEIEEFCLDRESPGIGMESRMLTTAMLTVINDLRRAKKSIFFLATNRLRAFDAAITRPGRFDMQLFVGTPNLKARSILFRQKLLGVSAEASVKEEAMETYFDFLSNVWDEDAKYMNYAEGAKFAGACANVVAKGNKLTVEEMQEILKSQTAVMTVRGAVRKEFDASMDMTRL